MNHDNAMQYYFLMETETVVIVIINLSDSNKSTFTKCIHNGNCMGEQINSSPKISTAQ